MHKTQARQSLAHAGSKKMLSAVEADASPYLDFAFLQSYLRSTYGNIEAFGRGVRAEVRQYDEIMEVFRQHVYSLRRLILSGSVEQSNDVLRRYFQVGHLDLSCTLHFPRSA